MPLRYIETAPYIRCHAAARYVTLLVYITLMPGARSARSVIVSEKIVTTCHIDDTISESEILIRVAIIGVITMSASYERALNMLLLSRYARLRHSH